VKASATFSRTKDHLRIQPHSEALGNIDRVLEEFRRSAATYPPRQRALKIRRLRLLMEINAEPDPKKRLQMLIANFDELKSGV
jgi:hypothetical protein